MRQVLALGLLLVAAQSAPAQAGLSSVQIVPPLPANSLPVALLAREVLPTAQPATVMSIVRYGHSATPRAPFGFPMSPEGEAAQLHRLDWLRAGSRAVEIRGWPGFLEWLRLDRGTQVLILSPTEVSAWSGVLQWRTEAPSNTFLLRLGSHELFGDGEATIERTPWLVAVRVVRGRFFLRGVDGSLTRLLAGESLRLSNGGPPPVVEPSHAEAAQAYGHAEREMQRELGAAVAEWVATATLTPERQQRLFEAAESAGPWFAHAARRATEWPSAPDRTQAHIGELLRFLNALEFLAPPLLGR